MTGPEPDARMIIEVRDFKVVNQLESNPGQLSYQELARVLSVAAKHLSQLDPDGEYITGVNPSVVNIDTRDLP